MHHTKSKSPTRKKKVLKLTYTKNSETRSEKLKKLEVLCKKDNVIVIFIFCFKAITLQTL